MFKVGGACVTVIFLEEALVPDMVTVAVRAEDAVFSPEVKSIVSLPEPEDGFAVNHAVELLTFQLVLEVITNTALLLAL